MVTISNVNLWALAISVGVSGAVAGAVGYLYWCLTGGRRK